MENILFSNLCFKLWGKEDEKSTTASFEAAFEIGVFLPLLLF